MSLRDEIAKRVAEAYIFMDEPTRKAWLTGKEVIDGLTDEILSLPEMAEMREKTKRYDELFLEWWKKDEWDSPEDMLKEWKEKAEKWDKFPNFLAKGEKLDSLMSDMWVRERCKGCEGRGDFPERIQGWDVGQDAPICPDCHGTGYIKREPTPEELTELWNIAKQECISCEGRLLKSGVIIFRKGEK